MARRRFLGLCAVAGLGAACGGSSPSRTSGAVPSRIAYGDHDDAFADLWLPPDPAGPLPVVVLVHGGLWRDRFGLDLMDPLADSVAGAGYAAWNIEYRRVGGGGGYPETFDDVAAAVDHLEILGGDGEADLDLDRVAVVGHSTGGQLAVWLASRGALPAGTPWADPVVRPVLAVAQAGILDLVGCDDDGLGDACSALLGGGPEEHPERYRRTSPLALIPAGVPVLAVHGSADGIVPLTQSATYVEAARAAGEPAELVVVDGADHFDLIDPGHRAWQAVLSRLGARL